jgi:polysaccharide chain length determinant protein (PEP-CTERM system associated)
MTHRDLSHDETPFTAIMPYLYALWRNIRTVFLCSLILAAIGVAIIAFIPDVYQAKTTILVDPQKISDRYVTSTVTSDPNERLDTLTQQVLSTSRLGEIIDKDDLYPEMRRKATREEVVAYMRKKIKIELKQGSEQGMSSFTIFYEDRDRQTVAKIANDLASSFIDWNLQVRQNQAVGTTQFLSTELNQAKHSLEEQEAQLEAFKMRHVGATPDQVDANLQAIARIQSQMQTNADAISRLDEERIMLTQVRATPQTDQAPLTEADRLRQERRRLENELWTLRRDYTDTYPDVVLVKSQLDKIKARMAAEGITNEASDSYDPVTHTRLKVITTELERHKAEQADLQRQVASYQGKVDTVPVLETQLTELTRNYETSRQNYQSLLDKTLSAGMSQDLERRQQAEHFVILDRARTPERPVRPNRLLMVAGDFGLSLLLSVGGVIASSVLLGRIETEGQLRAVLPGKVTIIGTVPEILSVDDQRHRRIVLLQTIALSAAACIAVIIFLHKMRAI